VSKAVKMCWSLTRAGGVVICHELSLWKEINTKQRGYDLIDKISGNDGFLEARDEKYSSAYKREVVVIN